MPSKLLSPATATIGEISRHMGLTQETVRQLFNDAIIQPAQTGPVRYRWRDVWSLEGVGYVSPGNEDEYRRPLLTTAEVRRRFFPHLKPRSITDRARKGTLPAILLGSDWRYRECDIRTAAVYG